MIDARILGIYQEIKSKLENYKPESYHYPLKIGDDFIEEGEVMNIIDNVYLKHQTTDSETEFIETLLINNGVIDFNYCYAF